MKKVYLVRGWCDSDYGLYFKKENALAEFQRKLDDAKARKNITIEDVTIEEYDNNEIYCIAEARDTEGTLWFTFVEMIEFKDEE